MARFKRGRRAQRYALPTPIFAPPLLDISLPLSPDGEHVDLDMAAKAWLASTDKSELLKLGSVPSEDLYAPYTLDEIGNMSPNQLVEYVNVKLGTLSLALSHYSLISLILS